MTDKIEVKQLTPAEKAIANPKSMRAAINSNCWTCSGENKAEVGRCTVKSCAFWHFRPWQRGME